MNRREFLKAGAGGAALALAGGCATAPAEIKTNRSEDKAVQDAKRAALESLRELGPTMPSPELRRKRNIAGKRAAFYIDDVIYSFEDLARQRPKSIWDHFFFKALREAHDKYGLKLQLNIFYRGDFFYGIDDAQFCITQMPDIWKSEFQAAKSWLRFGFHSWSEFPDYPWINSSAKDVTTCWNLLKGEVERFAGPGCWAHAVTPHWGPMSKEGCVALKDCGAKAIWCSSGKRFEYNGKRSLLPYGHGMRVEDRRKPETALFWRPGSGDDISVSACGYNHLLPDQVAKTRGTWNWFHDKETGCNFMSFGCGAPCLNLYDLKDIPARMNQVLGNEFLIHATHEEYWFPRYFAYQSDSREKLLTAVKMVHDAGYEYCFIEDKIDW